MKYCIICRQAFLEPDFFCPTHGLRLRSAEADQVRQCVDCASIIERGERFCRRCGFDVKDADWVIDAAGEPPRRNVEEGESEPKQARERVEKDSPDEDHSLRLRPFRLAASNQQHRKRSRRHGRIAILVAAGFVSLSVIAWHAFDFDGPKLGGQLNIFPLSAAPPANSHEPAAPPRPRAGTDGVETKQARSRDPEPEPRRVEDTRRSGLTEPELPYDGAVPTVPAVKPDERPVKAAEKPKTVTQPETRRQSTNAKSPATKTNETASAKGRPIANRSVPAPTPSPEEIQREREAERKRVQKEITQAIGNRGVSGVEVAFINGTVFLAGEVQTSTQKEAAEEAARRIPEVKDVRSRISVKWEMETQG